MVQCGTVRQRAVQEITAVPVAATDRDVGSLALRSIGIRVPDPNVGGRGRAARLGVEAVASQESVGPPAAASRIRFPGERTLVTSEESRSRSEIDPAVRRRGPVASSLLEELVDDHPIHALECELATQRDLAAGSGPVARLDPGPRERRVVEHPEIRQAHDRRLDEIRAIPGLAESAPDLGHGPRANLEKPGGRLEDDPWIVDGRAPLATFRRRDPLGALAPS
jgi:hypothetical protein